MRSPLWVCLMAWHGAAVLGVWAPDDHGADADPGLMKQQSSENSCSFCDVLTTVWNQEDSRPPKIKSADDRKALALDKFCKDLPKPLNKECELYVEQRGLGIMKLIDGGWSSEQVCTRFGKCNEGYHKGIAQKPDTKKDDKPPSSELDNPQLPKLATKLAESHKQMMSPPEDRVAGEGNTPDGPPDSASPALDEFDDDDEEERAQKARALDAAERRQAASGRAKEEKGKEEKATGENDDEEESEVAAGGEGKGDADSMLIQLDSGVQVQSLGNYIGAFNWWARHLWTTTYRVTMAWYNIKNDMKGAMLLQLSEGTITPDTDTTSTTSTPNSSTATPSLDPSAIDHEESDLAIHALMYDPESLSHSHHQMLWGLAQSMQDTFHRYSSEVDTNALLQSQTAVRVLSAEEATNATLLVQHVQDMATRHLGMQALPQVSATTHTQTRGSVHLCWWTKLYIAWTKEQIGGEGMN